MLETPVKLLGVELLGAELLGTVSCGSGILLLVDASMLGLWQHDREPQLDERYGPDVQEHANEAVDLELVGPDAALAGARLEAQWHPTRLYDVALAARQALEQELQELCAARGWSAELRVCTPRVPHRRRVDHALEQGGGAGEVWFHGAMAVAVHCGPSASIELFGVRQLGELPGALWARLELRLRPGKAERRREVGLIAVNEGQLCLADVEALAGWEHDVSLDGLADLIFWGPRARAVALDLGAPLLDDEGHFGWLDLPLEQALAQGVALDEAAGEDLSSLVIDYRPHSHHYRLLRHVWASELECGVLELAGERLACVLASHEEQVYTVSLVESAAGELLSVLVELAS